MCVPLDDGEAMNNSGQSDSMADSSILHSNSSLQDSDKKHLTLNDFLIMKVLGKGSFGKVSKFYPITWWLGAGLETGTQRYYNL